MQYLELHSRSAFSFLQGVSQPEELAARCAALEMPAMALLDHDGVYGAPRFHLAAQKLGIRAHIGAEITLEDGSVLPLLVENREGYQNLCRLITRVKLRSGKKEKQIPRRVAPRNDSIQQVATAKAQRCRGQFRNEPTAQQACRGYPAAASYDDLAAYSSGLIALTGSSDGPLAYALGGPFPHNSLDCARDRRGSDNRFEGALRQAERLANIFGPTNVYAELQRHFHRDQEARNQAIIEIAQRLNLPLLATNGVCYAHPEQRQVLDVFTCIRNKVMLETAGRLLACNSERYLKTPAEMVRLFADLPQAIANTVELSSRLQFTLADLGYQFPEYSVPPGETMNSFLRARTWEGARNRYGTLKDSSSARQQIERELALIEKLNLAGYFLIVWDIVRFCRQQGILVQGRGSAANSAVCYALGITAVDPIGMGLLFERFLSEERGEWPDIDLDLPSGDRRERTIQYVYERYGKCGAAMTANVITYRGRSAAREVGQALGFEEETVSRLASLTRAWEWRDPKDTPERQFRDAGLDVTDPRTRKFLELYLAIQDLPRHLGQHSGGMVLCQGRLDSIVPLEPATMPGRVVVQWDKDDCADMGMIKVDLLGLGMMAVLEDSLTLIREAYGEEVDLSRLPQDDPAVYGALQKADTIGLFQVESRAQMACLPRLYPKTFYDIVVQVGIIRPGPIVGNMVHPYLKRRQGKEPPECPHPALEPVLRRTLGVPLFQEQLLRVAMIAAGFSGGEAEELRRAFTHKRSEKKMQEIEIRLRCGMERSGIVGKTQDDIVLSITSFAEYGFPESHAASFALLAYASAYLKCHYLAAFVAALLNNQPMGFYQPATIIKDAQRHGLKILPIDVTRSEWFCTVEREIVARPARSEESVISVPSVHLLRLGLLYVKGLRAEAARAILRERARAPFASLDDLTRRVPELHKNELVRLAEVGALNWIGRDAHSSHSMLSMPPFDRLRAVSEAERWARQQKIEAAHDTPDMPRLANRNDHDPQRLHRRAALWGAERAARLAGPLLGALGSEDSSCPLASMNYRERLEADFRGTGLSFGKHPMALRRTELNALGVVRAEGLRHLRNGVHVRIAGNAIVRQRPGTAKGFVFLSLEDETGIANAIVTPDLFERCQFTLVEEPFLLIDGILQNVENVVSVKATDVQALASIHAAPASHDFH